MSAHTHAAIIMTNEGYSADGQWQCNGLPLCFQVSIVTGRGLLFTPATAEQNARVRSAVLPQGDGSVVFLAAQVM